MSVKTWGDYEIHFDRVLGRGGMGAVYMGRQVSVDRPAAIKILKKDLTENPEFIKRFQREAALLARLVDTHVVQVFGAGEVDGQYFYAMEFVEGEDLAQRLRRGYRFTPDEVLQIAYRVGKALQSAWRHKIVHRDIKPSNIVITKDNLIKVMDFGLAKNPETDLTQSEIIMGTAKYMSPEQATGSPCDIRSDLYSLGAVLYELATGKPPFVGETPTSVIYQHVHKPPRRPREINPAVPESLETVIMGLMAKAPNDRYSSPDALVSAVKGVMDGVTPDERSTLIDRTVVVGEEESAPATGTGVAAAPSKGSSAPMVITVVAILLILGVGGYFVIQSLQEQKSHNGDVAGHSPPPVPPPAPGPSPLPPAPPPSPGSDRARDLVEKAQSAMAAGQWQAALEILEEAKRMGVGGLEERIQRARYNVHMKRGDDEPDPERALRHYEEARKVTNTEEINRRINVTSYKLYAKLAGDNEGVDWTQAQAYWERALQHAEDVQRTEAESRRKFCEAYARARRSRQAGDLKGALALFDDLIKDPRRWRDDLEKEREAVRKDLEVVAADEMKRLKAEYEALVEAGRQAYLRADWASVRDSLKKANETRFGTLVSEESRQRLREAEAALAAPAGMVYVVSGKFKMGGGRDVESPEGEAETTAFYIDAREVTVEEYAAFLKALADGGHHKGCHKEELPTKNHRPDRWEEQSRKPREPVVDVDWWDACSYAAWRGRRLPTEAEFEKAAGSEMAAKRLYPWGNEYKAGGGRSFFGCENMGNGVLEWTANWLDKYPWGTASHEGFGKRYKVLRGGYQLQQEAAENTKTTYRHWIDPGRRRSFVGFRCVQDIAER